MPEITIPLLGVANTRGGQKYTPLITDNKDQRFRGVIFELFDNPITQNRTAYATKRGGLVLNATIDAGNTGVCNKQTEVGQITVYSTGTLHRVFVGGSIAGICDSGDTVFHVGEGIIDGEATVFLSGKNCGAYYLRNSAATGGVNFTGDTSSGSAIITNVSSTAGLVVGQKLTGSGIPVGTRILTIDSGVQITMNANATATASGVAIARERISKIIDADFPAVIGPMVEMDGYVFAATVGARIYNSDLNSISSWSASNYISANINSDNGCGLVRLSSYVCLLGTKSTEFFFNGGNPSGSILTRSPQLATTVGCLNGNQLTYSSPVSENGKLIAWISSEPSVYIFDGLSQKKISNSAIDSVINGSIGNVFLDSFYYLQRPFLHVAAPGGYSFFYDVQNNIWTETAFSNFPRLAGYGIGVAVPTTGTSGKYFLFSHSQSSGTQDDGVNFSMTIQTSKADLGTGNRKTYKTVWLMGSDVQSSGSATLEYSDDDYATWVTVGTFDLTQPQPKIDRAGSHRGGRAWRLTHTANTAFRAQALKFDYTVGAH